jgi:hypothetical protein
MVQPEARAGSPFRVPTWDLRLPPNMTTLVHNQWYMFTEEVGITGSFVLF